MKLFILYIVIAMCSAASALTEVAMNEKWENFKTQFNRKFDDGNEEQMRKDLFIQTLQKIEEHNKKYEKGEVTFTMGLNQFADRTDEEKRSLHGVRLPKQ